MSLAVVEGRDRRCRLHIIWQSVQILLVYVYIYLVTAYTLTASSF